MSFSREITCFTKIILMTTDDSQACIYSIYQNLHLSRSLSQYINIYIYYICSILYK